MLLFCVKFYQLSLQTAIFWRTLLGRKLYFFHRVRLRTPYLFQSTAWVCQYFHQRLIFTVRNEVAKVIFLHLSIILFTGGVCLSACWDTTPPDQAQPPKTRHPPGTRHHPPPGAETATAADGTHPTGMHSCCLYFFSSDTETSYITREIPIASKS